MADIITFYTPKGGQGKTVLSVNYALYSNSYYFTNDYYGSQFVFEKLFPEGDFNRIYPNNETLNLPEDRDSVFDFGGFLDKRIFSIVEISKLCIVPFCYQSSLDLQSFYYFIESLSKHNNNILVVLNNIDSSIVDMIYEGLKNEISYQIKIVKKSSYMSYLSNDGLTPFKIQGVTGAAKKPLDQLCGQLNELFNLIKLYKKG